LEVTVTQVLGPFTKYDDVPGYIIEPAQLRGTTVHRACFNYARKKYNAPMPLEYELRLRSFKEWFDIMVEKVILIEPELRDKKMQLVGHPDFILKVKAFSKLSIVDVKPPTGGGRIWVAQVAAYEHLALVNGFETENNGYLRLNPHGKTPIFEPCPKDKNGFNGFYAALQAFRYFNT